MLNTRIQWPIFDRIYKSKAEAISQIAIDNILIGRFVLIAYTDDELPFEERNRIEKIALSTPSLDEYSDTSEEYLYYYLQDKPSNWLSSTTTWPSKDRTLLQKVAEKQPDGSYIVSYQETTSLRDLGLQNLKLVYNSANKTIALVRYFNETEDILGEVNITDFLPDSLISKVEYDDDNNEFTVTWNTEFGFTTTTFTFDLAQILTTEFEEINRNILALTNSVQWNDTYLTNEEVS